MTLVIYADPAVQSSAGIELYTRELIRAAFSGEWAERTVLLTGERAALDPLLGRLGCAGAPVVETRLSARALRYAWTFAGAPAADRLVRAKTGRRVSLVHNPYNVRTPTRDCPQAVTVHDVFISKLPELLSRRQRLTLSGAIEARALRTDGHLFTPSASTKRDVVELFGVDPGRVTVTPLGVDHSRFRPCADEGARAGLRERLGLPERYVLYVGSLYSRKIGLLLEAFQRVARRFPRCKLVVVGGRESTAAGEVPFAERLRRLRLEDSVIRTGFLPAGDIPLLMSGAALFTYVSFYEGFGLSPLEAMACGAPVVISDVSSLPEVAGDAGIRVDPADAEAIAAAMESVLGDPARAAELRARSIARAAQFTWERTARLTFDVYESLMRGAG
ncbi:MAG TPA: glycosyltransferase family 1 protein [Longimicrobium sp.]|jgi:glycosyltransferase involved in cell wall biosynthesis